MVPEVRLEVFLHRKVHLSLTSLGGQVTGQWDVRNQSTSTARSVNCVCFGFARHYLVGTIRYYHKYDSLQNRLSQNRAKFSFFGENKITRHPMIAVGLAEVGTPDANLWHDPCQWWHRVLHNLWPQELFREWSGWCDGSGNITRSFCVTRSMEEVPSGGYRSCRRLRKWNANHNFLIYAS